MKTTINASVLLLFLLCPALGYHIYAQGPPPGDPEKGKSLFNAQCAGCHGITETKVGPPLGVPNPELEKLGVDYVLNWVHNPKALIDKGDAYATKIYNQFNQQIMPGYPEITIIDLHNIKTFIDIKYKEEIANPPARIVPKAEPGNVSEKTAEAPKGNSWWSKIGYYELSWILGILSFVLIITLFTLVGMITTLFKIVKDQNWKDNKQTE